MINDPPSRAGHCHDKVTPSHAVLWCDVPGRPGLVEDQLWAMADLSPGLTPRPGAEPLMAIRTRRGSAAQAVARDLIRRARDLLKPPPGSQEGR